MIVLAKSMRRDTAGLWLTSYVEHVAYQVFGDTYVDYIGVFMAILGDLTTDILKLNSKRANHDIKTSS